LIVGYGVVIPNTWYRCAAMVGVIAGIAFIPDIVVIAGYGVLHQEAIKYLALKALWLSVAGAIVVYGAYRIEIMRKEVFEARKLGQYVLQERLGTGGMGEVYLAEHVLLRRPCAIKLIRPERAGDATDLLRFEREVRTTATLTHPNTVQIFDYGHANDGTFYYVMEYLPGLTLGQLVKQHGPLPENRSIHFLRQVCGALREAHSIGLIHRDVKPGNVMICQRGGLCDVVKLLDFGLVLPQAESQDGERLTQDGSNPGTPAYMSPEQAAGRSDLDARSDIYGVGCLAYFLLTGQPPFAGRSAARILAAHIYEPPAPLAGVSAELEAIVLRCLAKEPADRFDRVEALDRALAACPAATEWTEQLADAWWVANVERSRLKVQS
jgi:serine/threonine-protein kinase